MISQVMGMISQAGEKERIMLEQKNIQEMTRREYCSYVQRQYSNDPQWVDKADF